MEKLDSFFGMMQVLTEIIEKELPLTQDENIDEIIKLGVEEYNDKNIEEMLIELLEGKSEEDEKGVNTNLIDMAKDSRVI